MLLISDTSDFIAKALAQTAYAKNYHTMLIRIVGASKVDKSTFGSFIATRATKIDTRVIFDNLSNPGLSQTEIDLHK